MRDASRAASEINVAIIGGHTGYSAGISRPLVAVTALGTAAGHKPVRTGGAQVGDYVLVTKVLPWKARPFWPRISPTSLASWALALRIWRRVAA